MTEADRYGFDGINLDFESLKTASGVHYIEFIRELSVSCRKKGLVLSVDNYVPAVYNRFYNQKEQGNVADYVIIMMSTMQAVKPVLFLRADMSKTASKICFPWFRRKR